jgi:DNA-binding CsgD family transcriptional regulator
MRKRVARGDVRAHDRAMPRRLSSPIFVGRVAERAAIADAMERAATGRPGIVLIGGEAGVGKTRLLAEAATQALALGQSVVTGACIDVAAGTLPYAPFVEIARALARTGRLAGVSDLTIAELRRLTPELGASTRHAAPGEMGSWSGDDLGVRGSGGGQGRMFAAVRDALAAASESSPLVVAIEDLHWADATTLDLLTYLARSMQAEHVLLLATARLDALPRGHPVLDVVAELARLPSMERIDLARFDQREIAEQLTGILGRVPDIGLTREVFERSDGNAFFAEELIATGAAPGGPLPASLRDTLEARLTGLDDASGQILRVAAVAGRVVSHELLLRVAGLAPDELVAALRNALEHRLLVDVADPVPGYAFRHALVREAAYDDMLVAERDVLHRAIADALEDDASLSPGGLLARFGEVAYHAMAARDLPRALSASLQAAAAAEAASAFAEAELHLERIVEIGSRIDDAEARIGMDRADLLARLARAAASAGHQVRAAEVGRQAVEALPPTDIDRRVTILLDLFEYAWEGADMAAAELAVTEALALVGEESSVRGSHAAAAAALINLDRGRYSSAAEAASRAIAIARVHGAKRELARALTVQGQVQTQVGETNHAEASLAEAAALFGDVSDALVRARSLRWRGWARYMHGAYEESLELDLQALDVARREGADVRLGGYLLDGALENLVELGRWSEAEATANVILARITRSFEVVYSHTTLARMYTFQGRVADADEQVALAGLIPAIGPHRVWQLEDSIFLAYASSRHGEGRELMETAIAVMPEPERDASLWWSLVKAVGGEADRAELARRRRRTKEADEAVAAGRRFAELFRVSARRAIDADGGGPWVKAAWPTVEAEESRLTGSPDPERWAAVVAARASIEQPWELAYAQFRHADAILAAGGSADGAAHALREAHQSTVALGALALQAAIEALAARARIDLETKAPSTTGGTGAGKAASRAGRDATTLTAREVSVLALVAAGHTNREIGNLLFISEKTASVHVTHAMEKLGALSRYEAAAIADRQGLLDAAGTT